MNNNASVLNPAYLVLYALFAGLVLFVIIRGIAGFERFDLSFLLWSIALFSLALQQHRQAESLR